MRINVLVKTKSKNEGIEKLTDDSFVVRINVPPIEGRANKRVTELLAKFFNCPKTQIVLIKGTKSKNKVFEI
ncbi:MAG: DUF167 domain-containing protein [Bdellovibrionales bacterium]|nr:DUF167 domain-containing protein [Bdellovibrionales bacterium]